MEIEGHNLNIELRQIQNFACMMQTYRAAIKEIRTKFEILDEEFQVQYEYNPIHHIESRLKSPKSIIEKLHRKGLPMDEKVIETELNDIAGVRVICNYIEDVEILAELLLRQDDITLISRKDYINTPKKNGYRSLHIVVGVPIFLSSCTKEVRVEIQIRTIAMDLWASLEHHLRYKATREVSPELRQRLYSCALTLNEVDQDMQSIYNEISRSILRDRDRKELVEDKIIELDFTREDDII